MKRKPPRPAVARRRPENKPPHAPAGRSVRLLIVVAVALVAGALWVVFRSETRLPGNATRAADPLAGLDPRQALETGMRIGRSGKHRESIPYFRHAVAGLPEYWQPRFDLSSALANEALEVREHLGRVDPAMHSSVERISAVLESERELATARSQTSEPGDLAMLTLGRAQNYLNWGMPVDALELLRLASQIDPTWEEPRSMARQIEADLKRGGIKE